MQTVSVLLGCHEHCCASFMPVVTLTRSGAAMLSKLVPHFGAHDVEMRPLEARAIHPRCAWHSAPKRSGEAVSPSLTVSCEHCFGDRSITNSQCQSLVKKGVCSKLK